jgi:hypothetical protein
MKAEQKVNITEKKNIEISHNVLQTLIKTCETSRRNDIEGVLFGHEDNTDKVHIEHAIPLKSENNDIDIIVIFFNLVTIS